MTRTTILLLFFSVFACTTGQKKDTLQEFDTNQIIFYTLTDAEFDSLLLLDTENSLVESFYDFNHYASKVLDTLQKTSIMTVVDSSRMINLPTKSVDKFDHTGFGVILVRKDSILIEPSVMTGIDYLMLVTEFYDLN